MDTSENFVEYINFHIEIPNLDPRNLHRLVQINRKTTQHQLLQIPNILKLLLPPVHFHLTRLFRPEDRNRIQLLIDSKVSFMRNSQSTLSRFERQSGVRSRRDGLAVIDVCGPESVSVFCLRDEEGVWARPCLSNRVCGLGM